MCAKYFEIGIRTQHCCIIIEMNGKVVRAQRATFDGLSDRGKRCEGCFLIGELTGMLENELWLSEHEESDYEFGEFAASQVQINADNCDGGCRDPSCKKMRLKEPRHSRSVRELVRELPASFREDVLSDAEAIANMLVRLCQGAMGHISS